MPGAASHAVPDLFPVPLGWWAFPKGTAMHTAHDLTIRWMIRRDFGEMLYIDARCYVESMTEAELIRTLKQNSVISVVLEHEDEIYGYCIYELVAGAIKIIRFGVEPKRRRCGVATALLQRLKDKLSNQRRDTIVTVVSGQAIQAQLCLARCGFVAEPQPFDLIRFTYTI